MLVPAEPLLRQLLSLLSDHLLKWVRRVWRLKVLYMPHPARVLMVDHWSFLHFLNDIISNFFGLFGQVLNRGEHFSQGQRVVILVVAKFALLSIILRLKKL